MTSICGKCGGKIPAGIESCPACNPPRKRNETVPALMIVILLCSSFLLVGTSIVNVNTLPQVRQPNAGDLNVAAYNAAKQFIAQHRPGVQNLSEYPQSSVEHTDRLFQVTIASDELDADNKPVRNFYRVEMEFSEGKWLFRSIKQ